MEIFRHGGEAHVMRPDRVYRTSVLSPMVGYQPEYDVEAVTRAFTVGPFLATTSNGMAGLFGGFGQPGPFKRLGLRIKAALAARRARKFMMAGLGYHNAGPAIAMGNQIAPHLQAQMAGVMMLTANRSDVPISASDALIARRLNAYYR